MYTPWFYPFADAYVSCEVDYRLVFRVQYTELSSSWLNTLYKFYSNLFIIILSSSSSSSRVILYFCLFENSL